MLRMLGYSIIRLILLIRNYRIRIGLSLWFQIAFNRGKIITIKSSLFNNPIELRKKDSDVVVFDQIYAEKQYHWKGIEELNPKVIVDAGANIGLAALCFSNLFPNAHIYCIEPDKANYSLLLKNTKNYSNIKTIQGALWHCEAMLDIENPEGFSAGLSLMSSDNKGKIKGYAINTLLRELNIDHIDILKIDIEGAEKEIFEYGDLGWLDKVSILVIELHDMYKEGTAKSFFRAMGSKIDKMYVQGENLVCFLQ